jgi:hypothetical protein
MIETRCNVAGLVLSFANGQTNSSFEGTRETIHSDCRQCCWNCSVFFSVPVFSRMIQSLVIVSGLVLWISRESGRSGTASVANSRGPTVEGRIRISPTYQSFVKLPLILWIQATRSHREDWCPWPASTWHLHCWGGSIHFAVKYWQPFWFGKGSTLPCNANEKSNCHSSVRRKWK